MDIQNRLRLLEIEDARLQVEQKYEDILRQKDDYLQQYVFDHERTIKSLQTIHERQEVAMRREIADLTQRLYSMEETSKRTSPGRENCKIGRSCGAKTENKEKAEKNKKARHFFVLTLLSSFFILFLHSVM